MTNQSTDSNGTDKPEHTQFAKQVAPLLTDLLYPSESDEPIEVVQTDLPTAESLTVAQVRDWLKAAPSASIETQAEADFWSPVTTLEDWFGDEERATAERFQRLKETVEHLLTDRQSFRVGETEIDVYLLGKSSEGICTGLKTRVVET